MNKNPLTYLDGETLMSTVLPPIRFVVDKLLPQGLHILAGAPKVGKSWLALWLCLCVAKGEPIWNFLTTKGSVLYLCLEDSYSRIQNRLLDITDNAPADLYFATVSEKLHSGLEEQIQAYEAMFALWSEFDPSIVAVKDVDMGVRKIAGVRVPVLNNVELAVRPFSLFNSPKWYYDGIALLQGLARTAIEKEFVQAKLGLLEYSRKKTTQKVNLFEKVQIPGYEDALRKIKRFMEDEENLSKSSQKILKSLQEKRKEAEA